MVLQSRFWFMAQKNYLHNKCIKCRIKCSCRWISKTRSAIRIGFLETAETMVGISRDVGCKVHEFDRVVHTALVHHALECVVNLKLNQVGNLKRPYGWIVKECKITWPWQKVTPMWWHKTATLAIGYLTRCATVESICCKGFISMVNIVKMQEQIHKEFLSL